MENHGNGWILIDSATFKSTQKTRGPKSASVSEIPGLKKKPSLFFVTWISIIFVNRLGNYLRLLWSESLENQNGIPQVQKT